MPRTTIRSEDITDATIVTADVSTSAAIEQSKLAEVTASDLASTLDLSSKTVTLPAASVTTHVTAFEDTPLRRDIATLALQSAISSNQAAHNLSNAFVDIYQDDTGIDAETTCDRDSGEFMTSVIPGVSQNTMTLGGDGRNTTITTGGGLRNNVMAHYSGTDNYMGFAIAYDFPLTKDARICIYHVDSNGVNGGGQGFPYDARTVVIGTGASSGVSYADINTSHQQDFTGQFRENNKSGIFTASTPSLGLTYSEYTGAIGAVSYDLNSGSRGFGWYENSGTNGVGTEIWYTRSNATMTVKGVTGWDSVGLPSSYYSGGSLTITEVPTTGQFWVAHGHANNASSYYHGIDSTTSFTIADNSLGVLPDINATGNYTSTTQTAQSTVSKMGIIVLYKNNAGTATLNTDLVASISANGGTNYQDVTLTAGGTFSTGILIAQANDITVTNTGTAPKFKISFANQSSGSKETQVHGVALLY